MTIPIRWVLASIETVPCTEDPPCGHPHERTVFRLPDGTVLQNVQVGDVYIEPWSARRQELEGTHTCPWTNCDGRHLQCVLPPDGHTWSIDGRASNCDQKAETTHRCWVRHGDPAAGTLHVDKNGHTCGAGGGSIATPGYTRQADV